MGKRQSLTQIRRQAKFRRNYVSTNAGLQSDQEMENASCHNYSGDEREYDDKDTDGHGVSSPGYWDCDDNNKDGNSLAASEVECGNDFDDDEKSRMDDVSRRTGLQSDQEMDNSSSCNHTSDDKKDNDKDTGGHDGCSASEIEYSHDVDDNKQELQFEHDPNCGESEDGDDDSSDDGGGHNDPHDDYDNVMDNVEMAMLTDTASIDVDKDLVIRLLAVLKPLKTFLSSRLGGGYSQSKQGNCALRLCNMLVWTALNSQQKRILDETTLLPWMEEVLKSEYTVIDSYCQYLEETKLYSASTIRTYLYDFG